MFGVVVGRGVVRIVRRALWWVFLGGGVLAEILGAQKCVHHRHTHHYRHLAQRHRRAHHYHRALDAACGIQFQQRGGTRHGEITMPPGELLEGPAVTRRPDRKVNGNKHFVMFQGGAHDALAKRRHRQFALPAR